MTTSPQNLQRPIASSTHVNRWRPYAAIVALWLFLLGATFMQNNTVAATQYHLSTFNLHALQAAVALPTLFIWLAILYAGLRFAIYARSIAGTKDGRAFRFITLALFIILAGMVLSSVMNQIRTLVSDIYGSSDAARPIIIITNYLAITAALLSYWWLYRAARALLASINVPFAWARAVAYVIGPMTAVSAAYLYLIFNNPYRTTSSNPQVLPTHALSDSLILLTVALPYIASWLLGMLALYGILRFLHKTPGIVYRQLFRRFATGITLVILLSIVLQLLTQFTAFFASTGLATILLIVVAILVILTVAYLFVAQGAMQLSRIEVVDGQ